MTPSSPPNRPPNPGRRDGVIPAEPQERGPKAAAAAKTTGSPVVDPAVVDAGPDRPARPDDGADPVIENGRPAGGGRRAGWWSQNTPGIPWTRMLLIGVICFAVWTLLDAPSLQRSAELSPLGTRRTVSLDVVGPIAALSRGLGLSHVVGWTDELFGRTPGGGPTLAAVDAVGGRSPRHAEPLRPQAHVGGRHTHRPDDDHDDDIADPRHPPDGGRPAAGAGGG